MALIAASTSVAAAPGLHDQNRESVRYVEFNGCTDTAEGYRCTNLYAPQSFDKKGNFQEAELTLAEEELDSDTYSWRFVTCPVAQSALAISLPGPEASFAASVDTASCLNFGMRTDLATGNEELYGFSGTLDVRGEWKRPRLRGSSQYTQHEKYDAIQWNYACNTKYGFDYQQVSVTVNGTPLVPAPGFVYSDICNLLSKEK
jgi:hypothetical protein